MSPEDVARLFHETYERLAPDHGYQTRKASAVPWKDVPVANKSLMIAVAGELLPAITMQIREQVAAEIEAERTGPIWDETDYSGDGQRWDMAMDHAARIARGEAR